MGQRIELKGRFNSIDVVDKWYEATVVAIEANGEAVQAMFHAPWEGVGSSGDISGATPKMVRVAVTMHDWREPQQENRRILRIDDNIDCHHNWAKTGETHKWQWRRGTVISVGTRKPNKR